MVNPEIAEDRRGNQVSNDAATAERVNKSWTRTIPLLNIKLRPASAPRDSIVYIWGGIAATGRFIVDLDNPWSLVGYNLRAMTIYRPLIRRILRSHRCMDIRCISQACRSSLKILFGESVYQKSSVHYPCIPQSAQAVDRFASAGCRFLFIGTQFEIKGGVALIKAFHQVRAKAPDATLDIITHLPSRYQAMVSGVPGIRLHPAIFTRDEIHAQFMSKCDVLVLPTYVESFGMVALEALAHGLAIIATDVYALGEMVKDGQNGNLLDPPLSIWDGVIPSRYYWDLENIKQHIEKTDTTAFEDALAQAMIRFAADVEWRLAARRESVNLMSSRFSC